MDAGSSTGRDPTRVLVVDDEEHVRRTLRRLLESYAEIEIVGEASSGAEAVTVAEERDPDVVLMDYRMASMNGIEATREIKQQRDPPRVVILTMYERCKPAALAAGADEFLLKGCPREALVTAVTRMTEDDGPGDEESLPGKGPGGMP
jgi:DNA-binding NarL/FixJ family response regulator